VNFGWRALSDRRRRLELFFRRLDADRSGPVIENIQLLGRRLREVDLSTSRVGSAVVDLDLDLLTILKIGDGGLGTQWQPAMRRRQVVRVILIATGRLLAVEPWAIP
jgi:hypothetical protein